MSHFKKYPVAVLCGTLLFSSLTLAQSECVKANEYIPFVGKAALKNRDGSSASLGTYSRISPDGRYVLRSLSGDHLTSASLMEIRDTDSGGKEAIAYNTNLKNEAFPVQGTWRFVNNIGGDHFRVADVIAHEKKASRQFKGGIEGFYATAAEMPGSTDASIKIRSLSWPNDGNQATAGSLKNKVIEVSKNKDGSYKKNKESQSYTMCGNLRKTEGDMFTLPMISTDGKEFAAFPVNSADKNPTMRIYEFAANNTDCKLVDDIGFATSKVIFGFPQEGKKAPLVFLGSSTVQGAETCKASAKGQTQCFRDRVPVSGIHLYDRDLKRSFYVGDRTRKVDSVDSFPGMTKDGRVVYGARWQDCSSAKKGACEEKVGYVIADPYQADDYRQFLKENPKFAANAKTCITKAEVLKVEQDQRVIYGMSSGGESAPPASRKGHK